MGLQAVTMHSDGIYETEIVLFFNPRSGSQMAKRYGSLLYYQYLYDELGARIVLLDVTNPTEKELGLARLR